MKTRALLAALVGLSIPCAAQAATVVVDFTADTQGFKSQGFSSVAAPQLSFFSPNAGSLLVLDSPPSTVGNGLLALASSSTQQSYLAGSFSTNVDSLSLFFGNDDTCCSQPSDVAVLRTYLGTTLVGTTTVSPNFNDVIDQSISFSGMTFDNFTFSYETSSGALDDLTEVVDNITFNTVSGVPEPATWAMMLAGFGAIGFVMRRDTRRRADLMA